MLISLWEQIVSLLLSINSCVGTKFGWGRHISDVPIEKIPGVLLVGWLSQILFTLSTSFVKLSILTFYLRLVARGTYRRVILGTIAFVTAFGIAFVLLVIFVGVSPSPPTMSARGSDRLT